LTPAPRPAIFAGLPTPTDPVLPPIAHRIAADIGCAPAQVAATIALLDDGATVPFIARYRKEATGGLDDTQLRTLEVRLATLRELEARREAVVASVTEQGKLTPALAALFAAAETRQQLEDLYAPYRQKRRTRAQIAREAGLEPLADALLADPTRVPEVEAAAYLRAPFTSDDGDNPGVADVKAALEGARHVLMERFADDAVLVGRLRERVAPHALIVSSVVEGREAAGATFRDWFDFRERIADIPSHRALALLRGRREECLRLAVKLPEELAAAPGAVHPCEAIVAAHAGIRDQGRAADRWLLETARWTWRVKLAFHFESELIAAMRERAEDEAIRVFARNLHDLLLAAPAGPRVTLGLDPGLRTGVKVAVVDATGRCVATDTIYPHAPRNDRDGALASLARLCRTHAVTLVAIGNGTASRETDQLVDALMRQAPELALTKAMVSEAGASVWSASEGAALEFPDLDVSLRGAVSIARRLQDPLAELVKIDPKAIGVGQYQHDIAATRLARSLDAVVEDCVNAVGVDVNTASKALLARISGLGASLADAIVRHRDAHGAFRTREQLKAVPRLGPKAFEQAAGFLRIADGDEPLDASAVHPEAYPLAQRVLQAVGRDVRAVMRDPAALRAIDPRRFVDDRFGLPTVQDILRELERPGRDPRPEFRTARFREGVETLADLRPGMTLEGVVTNVAAFGAFVDIGVHQDGLVHVSQLADRFVKDPHSVVKAGQVVKVRVIEVDTQRGRVALTMRSDTPIERGAAAPAAAPRGARPDARGGGPGPRRDGASDRGSRPREPAPEGALAAAFAKARQK
jgi:uncharacterized protein